MRAVALHVAVAVASIAGAVGYGLGVGFIVGGAQWLILPRRVEQGHRWILASAATLAVAVASCAGPVRNALRGFDPLAYTAPLSEPASYPAAIALVMQGFYVTVGGIDRTREFIVLAVCGLVIALVTARLLSSALAGEHQC